MNERIKELATQALTKCDANKERGIEHYSERFAELIIKECCNICYDNNYMTGEGYVSLIHKHFGVLDE